MTIRAERRVAWSFYALAVATASAVTPRVLALPDRVTGLVLVWVPLLAIALMAFALRRQSPARAPGFLDQESSGFSLVLILILIDAYVFYLGFAMHAMHEWRFERLWAITVVALILPVVLLAPEPKGLRIPASGLARAVLLRRRWVLTGTLLLALGVAVFDRDVSNAFFSLNGLVAVQAVVAAHTKSDV